jgi:tetratricopeptide (TPR) repeat protein
MVTVELDILQVQLDLRRAIGLDPTLLNSALLEDAFSQYDLIDNILTGTQLFQAGQSLEGDGNLEEAIKKYAEAIQLDPANAQYRVQLAKAYIDLPTPRWSEAEKELQKAIELSIDNDNYHFNLGKVYGAQGKYEEAIEEFQWAIRLNAENASYYNSLSDALLKIDGFDENALIAQETAATLEPNNLYYHFRLAEIYRLFGMTEIAEREYKNIIDVNSEYGDAYCGLAIIYYQTDQGEKASEEFGLCLEKSDDTTLKDLVSREKDVYESKSEPSGN